MTIDNYLLDLIHRMADRSDSMIDFPDGSRRSNPDAQFYKANAEAKGLRDINYFPQLKYFVETSKDEKEKCETYSILSYLYSNSGNKEIINYLISRLSVEKTEWTIYSILSGIRNLKSKLSSDVPIDTILSLTTNSKHLIRNEAIRCLINTDNPGAEEQLIHIIATSTNTYQLSYANATLARIGSKKSIPYLEKLSTHKNQDVAGTALNAILQLSDNSYLPLFLERLAKGKLKYIGLEGVVKYGDESVIPNVIKRVKELLAKKRTMELIMGRGRTELTIALDFLSKYIKENAAIKKMYDHITTAKKDFLFESEIIWLTENKCKFE